MRRILSRLTLIALFLTSLSAFAQTWHRGLSSSFRLTTDMGDNSARDALARLEQERMVVGEILHKPKVVLPQMLQIVQVRSADSLKAITPGFPTDALARGAASWDGIERSSVVFIAPAQWESASRAVALALLSVNYPHTPKWFDHGFARYVGSMQFSKEQIEIGRAPSDDKRGEGWIRISDVLANNGENNAQWQHESWLLVHWLISNSRLAEAGKYFYLTMNQQVPVREAIFQSFNEDAVTLDHDIQVYEAEVAQHVQRIPAGNMQGYAAYKVDKIPVSEAQIAISTAMLDDRDHSDSAPTAMKLLSNIMHNNPEDPSVQHALAYGYLLQRDAINATEHARRAIALADNDAMMHYIMAVGMNGGDASAIHSNMAATKLGNELNTALRMDPEFAPAFELRGLALMSSDKTELGLKDLGHAAAMRPRDDSYLLHFGEAQAASGDWDNARTLFAIASHSSDAEVAQAAAEQLKTGKRLKKEQKHWNEQGIAAGTYQDMTDPRWKPTPEMQAKAAGDEEEKASAGPDNRKVQHLDGTLVSVDCSPDPGAILTISSRGNSWKMRVGDRKTVLLIGPDSFSCQWKQLKVSVNYKSSGGVTGDVVSIETD